MSTKTLALGVGSRSGVTADELIALVEDTLARHHLSKAAFAAIGTVELKESEPAIHALARHLNVPLRIFTAAELNAEASRLKTPSAAVLARIGCPGVAEGAALALAGPESQLIVAKTTFEHATCAVAQAPAQLVSLRGRAPKL